MDRWRRLSVVMAILFLLLATACSSQSANSEDTIDPTRTEAAENTAENRDMLETEEQSEPPAGILEPDSDVVEYGSEVDLLQQLNELVEFYSGDAVRVTEGGEAILDFGDRMILHLFNDTEMNVVSASDAETPLDVQMFLEEGGFTGRLAKAGGKAVFATPSRVEITVLGTDFFVTHDPSTEETTIGNFTGTVEVESNGESLSLEEDHFVIVEANQPPGTPQELGSSIEDFEESARRQKSPITAVQTIGEWTMSARYLYELAVVTPGEREYLWQNSEGYSSTTPPVENSTISWSGTFQVDGGQMHGKGEGIIEGTFVCPLFFSIDTDIGQDLIRYPFEYYEIEGSFSYTIVGSLTSDQEISMFHLVFEGRNFTLTSTAGQRNPEVLENCGPDFKFYDYYETLATDTRSIIGDITVEAQDGALQEITDMDHPHFGASEEEIAALFEVVVTRKSE